MSDLDALERLRKADEEIRNVLDLLTDWTGIKHTDEEKIKGAIKHLNLLLPLEGDALIQRLREAEAELEDRRTGAYSINSVEHHRALTRIAQLERVREAAQTLISNNPTGYNRLRAALAAVEEK